MTAASGANGLVLTVHEVAEALGVSDDLVYELTARGEIPCLHLGRRRVIPRRALELMIERSLERFDAGAITSRLAASRTEARRQRRNDPRDPQE